MIFHNLLDEDVFFLGKTLVNPAQNIFPFVHVVTWTSFPFGKAGANQKSAAEQPSSFQSYKQKHMGRVTKTAGFLVGCVNKI